MSAAAADREAKRSDGRLKGHLMAAVRIYKGTLVCHNATGYLAPGADTANFKFAGVSYESVDHSSGAAGGKTCRAEKSGEYLFVYGPAGRRRRCWARRCSSWMTAPSRMRPPRTTSSAAPWKKWSRPRSSASASTIT